LASCVFDNSELALAVFPLLQQQSVVVRGNSDSEFDSAIAEVLVAMVHKKDSSRVVVKKIAESVNTILAVRGEIVEYSPEDVGRRLRILGIVTKRSGGGKYVLLCHETSLLAHRLARTYDVPSLVNAVHGCPDCSTVQTVEKKPPVHDVNDMHEKSTRSKA
jgi:precorrin-6x reductase